MRTFFLHHYPLNILSLFHTAVFFIRVVSHLAFLSNIIVVVIREGKLDFVGFYSDCPAPRPLSKPIVEHKTKIKVLFGQDASTKLTSDSGFLDRIACARSVQVNS